MASISKDATGNVTIQFVAADKRRRSVRLGKVNQKLADAVKARVETLNALVITRMPMDTDTARWVAGIGDDLAAKLAAVGLISPRRAGALAAFAASYLERRRPDVKPATIVVMTQVVNDLTAFFGAETDLRAILSTQAEAFKAHLQAKLAKATVHRRLKQAKCLFGHAVRSGVLTTNPFSEVRARDDNPTDRQYYLPPGDADRLLTACSPAWRIAVALARYGGLRCPSEVLSLRWEHVDLPAGRMTVSSPKTEHLPGGAYRVVPVFTALRPHLEEAWELAAVGEEFVVGGPTGAGYRSAAMKPTGWANANMRTTLLKVIRRAGLKPWPRLWHSLRASCETDLAADFPLNSSFQDPGCDHAAVAWQSSDAGSISRDSSCSRRKSENASRDAHIARRTSSNDA